MSGRLALLNATLFDGTGGPPFSGGLMIDGGRIGRHRDGKALAAVSISASIPQINSENVAAMAEYVKQCSASISTLLGFEAPL